MPLKDLQTVQDGDKDVITKILAKQSYTCTVKVIKGKLKNTGRDLPEYIITRTLRIFLAEGGARFKGGRWMSNELFGQIKEVQTGFSPRSIERPKLSPNGEKALQPTCN